MVLWTWVACAPPLLTGADLCDGSDEVNVVVGSFGGISDPPDPFLRAFGRSSLYVDGACNWYAMAYGQEAGPWAPVHTGTLDDADADALAADLQLGRWAALARGPERTVPDGGSYTWRWKDEIYRSRDVGGLTEIYASAASWADGLYPDGTPAVADAVQVLVWAEDGSGWVPPTWPAPWNGAPLAGWEAPRFEPVGTSTTGADADAFRLLRDDFLATGDPTSEVPLATDADGAWYVFVREDLPLPSLWDL